MKTPDHRYDQGPNRDDVMLRDGRREEDTTTKPDENQSVT